VRTPCFELLLINEPVSPCIAIREFVRRRPAREDVERWMIVQVDETGEDQVVGLEYGRAGNFHDIFRALEIDRDNATIHNVQPSVAQNALGSDQISAKDQVCW